MALTGEQKQRRIELLKRKRELLLQSPQSETQQFLPKAQEVEQKIGQREAGFGEFVKTAGKNIGLMDFINPSKRLGELAAQAVPPTFRRAEAAVANPALAIQRGQFNPLELGKESLKGITGERLGELGDPIRTTGFGGALNEPLAAGVGFLATLKIADLGSKGKLIEGSNKIQRAVKTGREAKRKFFFKNKAEQLNKGVDEVFTGVRKEFETIYNKIGGNPLGAEGRVAVQDIVTRNVDVVRKLAVREEKLGQAFFKPLGKGKQVLDANINTAKAVKTQLGKAIPNKVWSGVEDATEVQVRMIQDYHTLNDIIAQAAGPEREALLALNSKFKDLTRFNRIIKGITKEFKTGVTKTDIRNISTPQAEGKLFELRKFADQFYPKTNSIIKDIDRINRNKRIGQELGRAAKFGVGFEVLRRFGVNPILQSVEEAGGGGGGGNIGGRF